MVNKLKNLFIEIQPYLQTYFRGDVAIGGSLATYLGLQKHSNAVLDSYAETITPDSDLDIFIRSSMETRGIVEIFNKLVPSITSYEEKPGDPSYYKMPGIVAVKTFYADKIKVNVVVINPEVYKPHLEESLLAAMGHSLAQALLVPNYNYRGYSLSTTPAFIMDVKNQVVCVNNNLLTPKAQAKIEYRAYKLGYSISYKN